MARLFLHKGNELARVSYLRDGESLLLLAGRLRDGGVEQTAVRGLQPGSPRRHQQHFHLVRSLPGLWPRSSKKTSLFRSNFKRHASLLSFDSLHSVIVAQIVSGEAQPPALPQDCDQGDGQLDAVHA